MEKTLTDYLNESEQQYLKTHFPEYRFTFADQNSKSRPHALAALSREFLENLLIGDTLSFASRIVDIGGNASRHFQYRRTKVISYNLNDNPADIERNRDRRSKILGHFTRSDTEKLTYLRDNIVYYDGQHPKDEHRNSRYGIAIHSLYDIRPDDLYQIMSNFGMDVLYATLNVFEPDQDMYCGSLKWSQSDEGLYYQDDIRDGTSSYTHKQHPALYPNLKYIRGTTHIIKVSTYAKRGDQLVLRFTRIAREDITGSYSTDDPILQPSNRYQLQVPRVDYYIFNKPVYKYEMVVFHPDPKVVHRVENYLLTHFRYDDDVLNAAMDHINNINDKIIMETAKIRKKIYLSADEVYYHALFCCWNHRRRQASISYANKNNVHKLHAVNDMDLFTRIGYHFIGQFFDTNYHFLHAEKMPNVTAQQAQTFSVGKEAPQYRNNAIDIDETPIDPQRPYGPRPFRDDSESEDDSEPDFRNTDHDIFTNNDRERPQSSESESDESDSHDDQRRRENQHRQHFTDDSSEQDDESSTSQYGDQSSDDEENTESGTNRPVTPTTNYLLWDDDVTFRPEDYEREDDDDLPPTTTLHEFIPNPFSLTSPPEISINPSPSHEIAHLVLPESSEPQHLETAEYQMKKKYIKEQKSASFKHVEMALPVMFEFSENIKDEEAHEIKEIEEMVFVPIQAGNIEYDEKLLLDAPKQEIIINENGYQAIFKQSPQTMRRALAKRNCLIENEKILKENGLKKSLEPSIELIALLQELGAPTVYDPIVLSLDTIANYWDRIDTNKRNRLLEQWTTENGKFVERAMLFEKVEKLYKDCASEDAAKGHTIVSYSVAHNAMACILVEIIKSRLNKVLEPHNIIYTDGKDLTTMEMELETEESYFYNNDFSGQDARQNETAVANIGAMYAYFGLSQPSVVEIIEKYTFQAVQQGTGTKVSNGTQKPTGGSDTGLGNWFNNLCVHARIIRKLIKNQQLHYLYGLGDDMSMCKKVPFTKDDEEMIHQDSLKMNMLSESEYNTQTPTFCSRFVVQSHRHIRIMPNPAKMYNSIVHGLSIYEGEKRHLLKISICDQLRAWPQFQEKFTELRSEVFEASFKPRTANERWLMHNVIMNDPTMINYYDADFTAKWIEIVNREETMIQGRDGLTYLNLIYNKLVK